MSRRAIGGFLAVLPFGDGTTASRSAKRRERLSTVDRAPCTPPGGADRLRPVVACRGAAAAGRRVDCRPAGERRLHSVLFLDLYRIRRPLLHDGRGRGFGGASLDGA